MCAPLYHQSPYTSSYVFYSGTSTISTSQAVHIYANVGNPQFILFNTQQERRSTYNVALRRAGVTFASMIKHEVLHILSVCL